MGATLKWSTFYKISKKKRYGNLQDGGQSRYAMQNVYMIKSTKKR